MGALLDFSKLAELRARTDCDLASILNSELDRALALAAVAATKHSVFRVRAESAYAKAKMLLPKLSRANGTCAEIAALEGKLKELGMALELVPGTMDLEAATTSF